MPPLSPSHSSVCAFMCGCGYISFYRLCFSNCLPILNGFFFFVSKTFSTLFQSPLVHSLQFRSVFFVLYFYDHTFPVTTSIMLLLVPLLPSPLSVDGCCRSSNVSELIHLPSSRLLYLLRSFQLNIFFVLCFPCSLRSFVFVSSCDSKEKTL